MKKTLILLLVTALLLPLCFVGCKNEQPATITSGENQFDELALLKAAPIENPSDGASAATQMLTNVNIISDSSLTDSYAAAELQLYLQRKGLTVSEEGFPIIVKTDGRMAADSYRITATLEGDTPCLTIAGGEGTGVLYGVFYFLEKFAGVHSYAEDTYVIDDTDVIITDGVMGELTPDFQILNTPWHPFATLAILSGAINGNSHLFSPLTLDVITGNVGAAQPCLTDPENLPRAIEYVKNYLSQNPDTKAISFAPGEGNDLYCQCPNCARIYKEEGSHAGSYVRFINALVGALVAEYPNLGFEINIRTYLLQPPTKTKPADGISVRVSTTGFHINHPLTDTTCETAMMFKQGLEAWNALCDGVNLQYVLTSTTDYIPTFANLKTLRENIRFFSESGIQSIYCDGNFAQPSGEFGELRAYLVSRLLLDPTMSEEKFEAEMNSFLKAYYGDGWEYIRKYIDKTSELAIDGNQTTSGTPFSAIPQEEYLANEETFDGWWNEAEALAGDRIEAVKRARYQWRYIKLCLHPNAEAAQELIDDINADNMAWRQNQWRVDAKSDLSLTPDKWVYKFW